MNSRAGALGFIAIFSAWGLAQFLVPASTYWRDAGEFIISAFYLDIAHPAGFPLFAQVSNFFALIPFGPIAWRVNSFAAFVTLLNLAAVFLLARIFIRRHAAFVPLQQNLLAGIAVITFAASGALFRQTVSLEVYSLNAFVLAVLILLYERYDRTNDARLLLASAFLGGLGLANHVAISFALIPALAIILSDFSAVKKIIFPAIFLGLLGLSVYAYLPVRAHAALPLNTGAPGTASRLAKHLTDARDRALRLSDDTALDQSLVHLESISAKALGRKMVGDLKSLRGEVALPLLIVGALGLLTIALQYGRLGLLLLTTSISSWLFFLGWDADPWLPLIMGLSVGVSYFLALVIKRAMVASALRTLSAGVAFLGAFLIARPLIPAASPSLIRNFGLPASASAAQLDALPPHAVYMTEASWFLLTYLQSIEGYRKDVTLVYQPSILFPDYFAQTKLIDQKQNSFDSWALPSGASSDKNLGSFTDFASQLGEIDFEPNMLLNEFYQSIAQCDETGRTYLVRGQQKNCKEEFAEYVLYSSLSISTADAKYWSGFHSDTAHYFEGRLTSSADLLKRSNSIAAAINLLDRVCLWPQSSLCRLASLNNLAAYFLDAGNKRAAAAVLSKLVKDGYGASPAVRANLTQVQQHLDKNSVRELQNPD